MSETQNRGSHYDNRQREIELHNAAAHTHRAAEQKRGKQDHFTPHEQSRQTQERAREDGHPGAPATTTGHGIAAFGHDDIAALAYSLWQQRGCPLGSPEEDWFSAVKELRSRAIGGSIEPHLT